MQPRITINAAKDEHAVTERCNWFLAFYEMRTTFCNCGSLRDIPERDRRSE